MLGDFNDYRHCQIRILIGQSSLTLLHHNTQSSPSESTTPPSPWLNQLIIAVLCILGASAAVFMLLGIGVLLYIIVKLSKSSTFCIVAVSNKNEIRIVKIPFLEM